MGNLRRLFSYSLLKLHERTSRLDTLVAKKISSGSVVFLCNSSLSETTARRYRSDSCRFPERNKRQLFCLSGNARLWQDLNHNGESEAAELKALNTFGLTVIELDCKMSRKIDANGNLFRYRAKVKDEQNATVGKWAWDVFLVSTP